MYTFEKLWSKISILSIEIPCFAQIKSVKIVMINTIRKMNKSLIAIEMILLFTLIVIYYLSLPINVKKLVHIPQGSVTKIIAHLQANESISLSKLDKHLFRFFGYPQSGWIDLKRDRMSKADLLYKLSHSKAAVKSVTLVPGETKYFFLKLLAKTLTLNEKALHDYYNARVPLAEGYFVPETYNIPLGLNEEDIIGFLYHFSLRRHQKLSQKLLGSYSQKKWFDYLRMASVIQKEAANLQEMPLVASVIYNRLKKGMRLQMDGTLNYGVYSHQKVTAKRIRNDKSRFNTYKYRGLPHLPVCAVSSEAIKAAHKPVKSDYLYFMKNKQGVHDFTRYYSTHLKNIANGKK